MASEAVKRTVRSIAARSRAGHFVALIMVSTFFYGIGILTTLAMLALAPFVALHDAVVALGLRIVYGYWHRDFRAIRLWPWFDR